MLMPGKITITDVFISVNEMFSVVVVVLALIARPCLGFGSGAPDKACESMTPGHGTEQTGTNTYTINIRDEVNKYKPGTDITGK